MNLPESCLQLDVGNSSAKWRLLCQGEVSARGKYVADDPASTEVLLGCGDRIDAIWISSVASAESEGSLATLLKQRWGVAPWFARTAGISGDLVNSYADPSRMGVDRWLAMLGARSRSAQRLCVVDAGSALTIDFVAADGRHEGGYIIPGPGLMERALLLDTDRVRFDEAVDYSLTPGRSTAEAVRHGIALSQVGAVATALEKAVAGEAASEPELFFCGGGGEFLVNSLGRGGHYVPDLVFDGLALMASLR
jgi:type III pantothenate kinase